MLKNQAPAKTFKVNYRQELNAEQWAVVGQASGPCLVLAGAGSGKTRTIVYRVAYLIENGVNPENILLVTFTNKAAAEMLSRVQDLLGYFPEGLWGGTFHHIGNRILRQYAGMLGFDNNFSILDEEDSISLIKLCLKEEDIDFKAKRFPSPAVLKDLFSFAKNSQIKLEDVLANKHPKWMPLFDQMKRVSARYEQKKQKNNSLDFDDLLVYWLKLLRDNPNIKDRLAAQFNYILVDEYQDTNYLQAEIVRELASVHRNVLAVGDDSQSIYSFRAADIGNILNFPKVFTHASIFKLETNYRSTPQILSVANTVIANNKNQFKKVLQPSLPADLKPNLVPATSARQEAKFIAEQILQLREDGLPLNKIAVLFRAAYHSQELEFELTKRDIPYDYRGGVRFFERAHIKDIVCFLRVIANPADEVAWHRILNLQTGIGEAGAIKIFQQIKSINNNNIGEILQNDSSFAMGSKNSSGWQILQTSLKQIIGKKAADMVRLLAKSDYRNYLEAEYPNWQERLDDLEQLALFAERYRSLNGFLSEISLQENFSAERSRPGDSDEEKIVLSTIHQAKGLEWRAVFIINLTDSAFPNPRALAEANGLEEERRLFYVAITRAQKYLFLSYPIIGSYNSMTLNTPSQFLSEIKDELLEEIKLAESNIWNRKDLDDGAVRYLPDIGSL